MQAEMATLRSEVTHSDKNLCAGLQNSDVVSRIVPGNGPTKKRKRTASEGESKIDDDNAGKEELELIQSCTDCQRKLGLLS